jgi:hypothetical protein
VLVADLEWWLASHDIVETEMEENPRKGATVRRVGGRRTAGDDSDEDEYNSDT